ncbi:MAG: hypothetical protein GF334_05980 [Candidatus Altiarchaeales archaeon]|nr:hypothetical protein [Candidatus Altiarchaeales archaeon]
MPLSYTMMAYESVLTRTVYWTVLYAPDFVGDQGPYTPANLSDVRVKVSRHVRESGPYTCDTGVSVLEFVYFSASGTVDEADSTDTAKIPAIGVVVNKPTTTSCLIAHEGEIEGFAGLTAGSSYYLTSTGGLSSTAPSTPGEVVQRVGIATSATTLFLTPNQEVFI